ncbi:PLP-dependent transferase [Rhizophagus irregularis]|uniref:PLP-dependent transferase n=1 Tax=Rhizophagus irregularis TaxID=588596 RepID=A0A2N0SC46_9GLOM|nr:PLP-dependent transferase [Rhizophagus irregularis]
MWEYQLSLKIHVIVNNTFGTGEYLLNQLNMVQMLLFTVGGTKWIGGHGTTEDTFEYNAFTMKARSKIMRNIGPMSNPFGSFLLIQGLKTLLLRIWTYLAFGVKGDANVGGLEPHSLMLYYLQDAKTLVIHSSSTTHQQLMDEEQLSAGVNKKMIRLTRISVGYEHIDDIKEDFTIAFGKIKEIN